MFGVEGYVITLSRGDTGAIKFTAQTDHTFDSIDRALFSIKNAIGEVVKQAAFEIDENKAFVVSFYNADTDHLAAGTYQWDVRYILHPYYDSDGNIIDGELWQIKAFIPNFAAYVEDADQILCCCDNMFYSYSRYSTLQQIQKAWETLGDFRLTEEQKKYYGLN